MSIREHFDLSAYLVIGPENTKGRAVEAIIAQAVRAGFTCVQLRSKQASAGELIELTAKAAAAIAALGKSDEVALLVDDRLDVVLAAREQGIKVDGIHVGQSDVPVSVCRKFLGEEAIVGLSAAASELIHYVGTVDCRDIDYFGAGPLHYTETKPDCGMTEDGKVILRTLEELRQLSRISPLPLVIGGGVKQADLAALKATGVDGFFVVSAVAAAEDPLQAATELVNTWREA